MKTLSKLSAAALCAVLLLSGCTAVTPGGMLSSTLSDHILSTFPLTASNPSGTGISARLQQFSPSFIS